MTNFNWNATAFFERLTASNKLAQQEHFAFLRVSGLEGLEEALHTLQRQTAFVAVSDIAQGYTELNNTPHTRRVKTIFICMRHALDNMTARQQCMDTMRELFRQFMSVMNIKEFFADSLGRQFFGIISDALDQKKFSRKH